MIVVDTNVLAYLLLGGDQADRAEKVLLADNEWHAPLLWRSELRNVLALVLRRGDVDADRAREMLLTAEDLLYGREHLVPSEPVMEKIESSSCSAYDCEFVALAEALGVRLVTEDRKIRREFPETALSMESFLDAIA